MIKFTKVSLPYGWMGNMSPYPIKYEGKMWKTTEALFQAMRFQDEDIKELIRAEKSPMGAKMKAKSLANKMVITPTSDRDVENMRLCLTLKLEQHPELYEKLRETGDQKIVEDVTNRNGNRHLFWGAKVIEGEIIGKNIMGELWMEKRDSYLF